MVLPGVALCRLSNCGTGDESTDLEPSKNGKFESHLLRSGTAGKMWRGLRLRRLLTFSIVVSGLGSNLFKKTDEKAML
jgi:hypothetical protein